VPLMAILLCHEMGHYLAARWHHVPASLPFFVPLPPGIGLFGTMGAVILQSRTSDRRKLIDIGAAGPLAGLVVAIPVVIYGLSISPVQPLVGVGVQEGNSILYAVLKRVIHGAWLPGGGSDVMLHRRPWPGGPGCWSPCSTFCRLDSSTAAMWPSPILAIATAGRRASCRICCRFSRSRWLRGLPGRRGHAGAAGRGFADFRCQYRGCGREPWLIWFILLAVLRRLSGGIDHPPVDDRPLPASRAGFSGCLRDLRHNIHARSAASQPGCSTGRAQPGDPTKRAMSESETSTSRESAACPKCGHRRTSGAAACRVAVCGLRCGGPAWLIRARS